MMNTHASEAGPPAVLKRPVIVLLLLFYLAASLACAVAPLSADARRRVRTRTSSFFSRMALRLFNVRVRVKHRERFEAARTSGCLLVANHVSYVDVLALSALMPAVFITSVELGNTLLLGLLARSGGSLFVERRKPSGLKREIESIAGLLFRGFTVVLFPEATTSNGDRVHPFKRSLFDAAVAANADVMPVCLRYTDINGGPVSASNRDSLFYYGGTTFSRHFPAFLALASVDLEIAPLHAIRANTGASRKELAEKAHELISREYERDHGSRQG